MSRRRGLWPALAGLLATLLVVVVALADLRALRAVDLAVIDAYQRAAPRPTGPEAPVRVVVIDEASIERLGQWPWSRTVIARLIDRLTALGAAAIAFDVVFGEPDRTAPARLAQEWAETAPALAAALRAADAPDPDTVLAEAIARAPVVLGTFLSAAPDADAPVTPASVSIAGSDPRAALARYAGVDGALPELAAAASGIGSVSLSERFGGVIRSVPLVSSVGGAIVPALSVEALRVAQGAPGYLLRATDASGERGGARVGAAGLRVGELMAPLTADGAIWVRYADRPAAEPIPAWRLLGTEAESAALADEISGRIVFVGASAAGLRDLVATPMADQELGVAVHAQIVEQLVAGAHLARPDWAAPLETLAALAGGMLVTTATALGAPLVALGAAGLGLAGGIGLSWIAFRDFGLILGPFWPTVGALLPAIAAGSTSYFLADRQKREVRRQFEHFVSADIVAEIAADPARYLKPSGEVRDLTLLFADVRGFSRLSEGLPPEALIALVNDVLTPLSDAVLAEGGTIDKYMGDAVMAFWNAPRPTPDHADRALAAALAMRGALAELNRDLAARGRPAVAVGVGVNTGACSVGSMGSRRRLDYSCIGDPVNVAARLEGLTRVYGVAAIVGEATARAVTPGRFALLAIDIVRVKGRDAPEPIHALLGDAGLAADPAFALRAARHAEALEAYRARDWAAAHAGFATLAAERDGPAGLDLAPLAAAFLARVDAYAAAPPPSDWDGVWEATSK